MQARYLNDPTPTVRLADSLYGCIPCVTQNDQPGFAGQQLQDHTLHFAIHAVLGGHDKDRQALIDQGQGAMLHFPCQNALAVDQSHLLYL